MSAEEVVRDCKEEMKKTMEALRRELGRVRTGRASPALLEGVYVDYYGAKTPLQQLATLSAPEPRLLVIQPYDKSAIESIEKGIQEADLGLNPMNDGKILRVPIPELTEDRRKELVRHIRKLAEDFRISVRNHRRDALDMLKEMVKEKEISEDDEKRYHDKVEALVKESNEQVEKILKKKEEEVLEV